MNSGTEWTLADGRVPGNPYRQRAHACRGNASLSILRGMLVVALSRRNALSHPTQKDRRVTNPPVARRLIRLERTLDKIYRLLHPLVHAKAATQLIYCNINTL